MAATTRLAASSGGTRNRAGAKIAELSNLLSDSLTSLLDIGQRMRHGGGPPVLAYHIRKEYRSKKETPLHLTSVSRTRTCTGPCQRCSCSSRPRRPRSHYSGPTPCGGCARGRGIENATPPSPARCPRRAGV